MKTPIALVSILILTISLVLVGGCAKPKPFEYHPGTEIPQGPGVFSKEKGEFTLYDSNKAPAAATAPSAAQAPPADSKEFKQFREWKKEQQEFEAFQEWKKSEQGSREYQEFQEWKRWKAYSDWMESQKQVPAKP